MQLKLHEVGQELTRSTSKKDIQALAARQVQQQMDEGYVDPLQQLVVFTKLAAYCNEMVSQYRPHATRELAEQKSKGVLGAVVERGKSAGEWLLEDPYLTELEEEIKTVKEKSRKKEAKDRLHVTLSGEEVYISPARYVPGGESVKVKLQ